VPRIVEYPEVERTLTAQGLVCVYPNSGAFSFPKDVPAHVVAWTGGDDPTIRPEARAFTRPVALPYEATLAALATSAWRDVLPGGPAWLMPKSHWAYELEFGSDAWMPGTLAHLGVGPRPLRAMNTGAAIAFDAGEAPAFRTFVEALLTHLDGSDFLLALPGRPVVCTVHHHKQLWWVTSDAAACAALQQMVPPPAAARHAPR
jgi:hypothetical protein